MSGTFVFPGFFFKGTSKNCFGEVKLSRTEREQEREVANTGGMSPYSSKA
jgi:hypothetical protein